MINFVQKMRLFGLATVLAAVGAPVMAHPDVVSSAPAAGTTSAPPRTISLQMSEKFEPKFSGLELVMGGSIIPIVPTIGGADGKTMKAVPKRPLAPGRYKVIWHAVGADGHRVKGNYSFSVK